jgi:hypothetical protein
MGRIHISDFVRQTLVASPRQPGWPQVHITSVLPAIASQWVLQYFEPSAVVQLQAGFEHFLGFVIVDPSSEKIGIRPAVVLLAGTRRIDARRP